MLRNVKIQENFSVKGQRKEEDIKVWGLSYSTHDLAFSATLDVIYTLDEQDWERLEDYSFNCIIHNKRSQFVKMACDILL